MVPAYHKIAISVETGRSENQLTMADGKKKREEQMKLKLKFVGKKGMNPNKKGMNGTRKFF